MCRLRSTIPSASKRLSQYSLFFALSLGFMLLHQKKNHQKIVFLVPHAGVEPTNQKWCPNLNRVCLPIPPMGHIAEILGLEPRRSDSKSEMLPITSYLNGRCGRTRTCDTWFWRPALYQTELHIQASAPHTKVQGGRYLFHRIVGYKVESFPHPSLYPLKVRGRGVS